jgi:hypothetical protein
MTISNFSFLRYIAAALSMSMLLICTIPAHADESSQTGEGAQILQEFNKQHRDAERAKAITDKDKQRIMFLLGVVLITLVMITGGLGIAMGLYGKQVFAAHMIFAGLSMTLAVVHAVVGIVWFFPF